MSLYKIFFLNSEALHPIWQKHSILMRYVLFLFIEVWNITCVFWMLLVFELFLVILCSLSLAIILPLVDKFRRITLYVWTSKSSGQKNIFFLHGTTAALGPGPPRYLGFTITLRHTTLGRTPLDEWSARRRDLYLTTHNTHEGKTSVPPAGFEPAIPASERPFKRRIRIRKSTTVIDIL